MSSIICLLHNNQENKKVPPSHYGTKKLRVATQIAAVRPLESMIKDTTLRLSPGTPKVDTPGTVLHPTTLQFSETAAQAIAFLNVHMYLLYLYLQKKQEDIRTFVKKMLFPFPETAFFH